MIIIPTEKRFDWKHAPLVLLAVVLLNIFIYFIPQSSDNQVLGMAFVEYQQQDLLKIEWPFLQRYLKEREQEDTLEKLEALYTEERHEEIIGHILFDNDFYRYLRIDKYDYFHDNKDVGDWFFTRERINNAVQSTTMVSFGLTPANMSWYSALTHQFLHGSVMHLLGNMFFLVIFGFAVEAAIGHWRFLLFYLISGIAGGLLHALFNLKAHVPLVGASGAISGAMAMYLCVFRLKKIEFFYWFFVFVGYFKAPALLILLFYIGKELAQFLFITDSNVAFLAHIGGFLAGAILTGVAYKLNPNIINEEYIEEDQSIDPLQEKKATVYDFLGRYQFEAAEKALTRIIESEGLDFELAFIRYNIEKIDKDHKSKKAVFSKHLVELLTTRKPTEQQANQLEHVWQESKMYLEGLETNLTLKIAISLAEASSPKHAAELFDDIYQHIRQNKNPEYLKKYQTPLAILAKKLADAYRDKQPQEEHKYTALKNQILTGHSL